MCLSSVQALRGWLLPATWAAPAFRFAFWRRATGLGAAFSERPVRTSRWERNSSMASPPRSGSRCSRRAPLRAIVQWCLQWRHRVGDRRARLDVPGTERAACLIGRGFRLAESRYLESRHHPLTRRKWLSKSAWGIAARRAKFPEAPWVCCQPRKKSGSLLRAAGKYAYRFACLFNLITYA